MTTLRNSRPTVFFVQIDSNHKRWFSKWQYQTRRNDNSRIKLFKWKQVSSQGKCFFQRIKWAAKAKREAPELSIEKEQTKIVEYIVIALSTEGILTLYICLKVVHVIEYVVYIVAEDLDDHKKTMNT